MFILFNNHILRSFSLIWTEIRSLGAVFLLISLFFPPIEYWNFKGLIFVIDSLKKKLSHRTNPLPTSWHPIYQKEIYEFISLFKKSFLLVIQVFKLTYATRWYGPKNYWQWITGKAHQTNPLVFSKSPFGWWNKHVCI